MQCRPRREGSVSTELLSDGGSLPPRSSQEATARPALCPVPAETPWAVGSAPRPGQAPAETAQLLPATFQGAVSADSRVLEGCPEERQRRAATAHSDPGMWPLVLESKGELPTTTQPGEEG